MKTIYRFHWDCRRMGTLSGLFIADTQQVAEAMGKKIDFGEVLGKHSEIYGVLEENDLEVVTDDQQFIQQCITVFGDGTISGYNPLEYQTDEEIDFDMNEGEDE